MQKTPTSLAETTSKCLETLQEDRLSEGAGPGPLLVPATASQGYVWIGGRSAALPDGALALIAGYGTSALSGTRDLALFGSAGAVVIGCGRFG